MTCNSTGDQSNIEVQRNIFLGKSVCFFAPVDDISVLRRSGFYTQDLDILEDLGFDVHIATKYWEIKKADIYFVWWWTWAFKPIIRAKLARKPLVITGTFNDKHYDTRRPIEKALMKFSLLRADANVLVSLQEKTWVDQQFPQAKCHYIPHGVDTDIYHPSGAEREDFCFTACWMALPNCRRKSMFELIRAIPLIKKAVPNIRFQIAGELKDGGPELQALVDELGVADAVAFLGPVSESEKIRLMQTCRIYLQPSRYEGFGLAIAEAMACGAPVVTSAVGAVPEVVGECGIYVDGNDPTSIADGVIRSLLDPEECKARGERGHNRIEANFSLRRRREGLAEIFSKLV